MLGWEIAFQCYSIDNADAKIQKKICVWCVMLVQCFAIYLLPVLWLYTGVEITPKQ